MMRGLRELRLTILLAIAVTLIVSQTLVPIILDLRQAYINAAPVVAVQGELINRGSNSATLHLWGEKLRACTYVKVNAYTLHDGMMVDASTIRIDAPDNHATRPLGPFDMGEWRVWPVAGASKILIFVQHDCNGRVVITKIAEVDL